MNIYNRDVQKTSSAEEGVGATVRQARALVIFNRGAGTADARVDEAITLIRQSGIPVSAMSAQELDAMAAPERLYRNCDRIVVCGGDGTLNHCAPFLLQSNLPVAIIPLGTANDLARTLGIPTDVPSAVQIAIAGREKAIDVGRVNGRPFFNVASIGLSVDLAQSLSSDLKRRWGRLGYAIAALRVLFTSRPMTAWIDCGAETIEAKTLQIAVGNGRYYGSGMAVHEDARIDDGQLDLYSLELESAWGLMPLLWSFRNGRHGRDAKVRTLAGQSFEVRTRRPRRINCDGEVVGRTPARFEISPGALRVFVTAAPVAV